MNDYSEEIADARAAIEEDGAALILSQRSGTTFNQITGKRTAGTVTNHAVSGIIGSSSKLGQYVAKGYFPGTVVEQGDLLVTLPVYDGVVPGPGDVLTFNGVGYHVCQVGKTDPGGIPILYHLQIRS